jgi:hypothetical protein
MPTVGVTGHVLLPAEMLGWIVSALRSGLQERVAAGWHGITCLAQGADQMFASVMVELKGRYDVVLPAEDYPQRMAAEGNGEAFSALLAQAGEVRVMAYPTSSRQAYLAASEDMLSRCDLLLAVWNGVLSREIGDTADVVGRAQARGIRVIVLWPP